MRVYTDSSKMAQFFENNAESIHNYFREIGFDKKIDVKLIKSFDEKNDLLNSTLQSLVELQEFAYSLEESNLAEKARVSDLESKLAAQESKINWLRSSVRKRDESISSLKRELEDTKSSTSLALAKLSQLCNSLGIVISSMAKGSQSMKNALGISRKVRDFKNDCNLIENSHLYDERFLKEELNALHISVESPLEFFVKFGAALTLSPSEKFDSEAYFSANPDVKDAGINPLLHYLKYGESESRSLR